VLVNDVKAEIKSSLQNNIRTEPKEIEDQKQRGLNLIILNVPESKSENSLERKKFDNDIFTEFFAFSLPFSFYFPPFVL
jgi:hypothetical protein